MMDLSDVAGLDWVWSLVRAAVAGVLVVLVVWSQLFSPGTGPAAKYRVEPPEVRDGSVDDFGSQVHRTKSSSLTHIC